MKLRELIKILPPKSQIRIIKAGYPMLYQGSMGFINEKLHKEVVSYIRFEAYRFRKKGTRYRVRWERELLPVPFWVVVCVSDRKAVPKEEKKLLSTPPSEVDPIDEYGEVGADYFDEEDK